MMKIFGKDNDFRADNGKLTKQGYIALALSSVFGFCLFFIGRLIYGKKKNTDRKAEKALKDR